MRIKWGDMNMWHETAIQGTGFIFKNIFVFLIIDFFSSDWNTLLTAKGIQSIEILERLN